MSPRPDRLQRAWDAVGRHANAPELIAMREQALARARRAHALRWFAPADPTRRRWLAAAAIGALALAIGAVWQMSPYGYTRGIYQTGVGEQRVVELQDHSRVALDADTRLRVRFTPDTRTIQLISGQAQFSVAHDPVRPFKVEAGSHTIVAVGTTFTVEYIDREIRVAMIEGKVAIGTSTPASISAPPPIQLAAGEALRVTASGATTLIPKADLEAATAWREGKVIFHSEPLGDAIRRLNRYSNLQLKIDDAALAALHVSGVFEAGDTQAFAQAVEAYLPVRADYSKPNVVRLVLD